MPTREATVEALQVGQFASGVGGGKAGHQHRVGGLRLDRAVDTGDDRLPIHGVGEGPAHIEIVEGRGERVKEDVVGTEIAVVAQVVRHARSRP